MATKDQQTANEQKSKQAIINTFNTVAPGYDNNSLRFFSISAERMASYLQLSGNEHLLDVASGTGHASLALAPHLESGKITAIDFSESMLKRAQDKISEQGINNVELLAMDMESLDYPDDHFDAAVCAFGIFFAPNMNRALSEITRTVKPGGKILISTFHKRTFHPYAQMCIELLAKYDVIIAPETVRQLSTEPECKTLFYEAGLSNASTTCEDISYHLDDADGWWDIVWNAALRRLVNKVAPKRKDDFKREHIKQVQALATEEGLRLNVEVLYTLGTKPA